MSDLRALGKLPHLRTLNVSNNRAREFLDFDAPLALAEVDYSYNKLAALGGGGGTAALSAHKFLTTINASHNAISSLSSLQALPFLASLDVSYNKIFDVSSIGTCVRYGATAGCELYVMLCSFACSPTHTLFCLHDTEQIFFLLCLTCGWFFFVSPRHARTRGCTRAHRRRYSLTRRTGLLFRSVPAGECDHLSRLSLRGNRIRSVANLPLLPALTHLVRACARTS